MKSNQKGFTLIELLAVIVILAVIALIATPIVLRIITKARISAAQNSLYGVMEATKYTYANTILDNKTIVLPLTVTCSTTGSVSECTYSDSTAEAPLTGTVEFSGTIPSSGTIILNDKGNFQESQVTVNGFDCTISGATQTVTCK